MPVVKPSELLIISAIVYLLFALGDLRPGHHPARAVDAPTVTNR